jgi:hypothetical protein
MFILSVNVDVAVSGLSHNNVKHENLQNVILNSVNLQIFPVAYILVVRLYYCYCISLKNVLLKHRFYVKFVGYDPHYHTGHICVYTCKQYFIQNL